MKNDILKKGATDILKKLAQEYPESKSHLEFKNPFELLISTVLAAQCTDVRVNMTMPPLYKSKYKSPKDILKDGEANFRQNIKSISFPNNGWDCLFLCFSVCFSLVLEVDVFYLNC